jgi:hypothetical protein
MTFLSSLLKWIAAPCSLAAASLSNFLSIRLDCTMCETGWTGAKDMISEILIYPSRSPHQSRISRGV